MPDASSERRYAPRAPADFPLQLSPDAGALPARLQNISTTGLCCTAGEAFSELTKVAVHLELPGSAAPAPVTGVVVRCERDRATGPDYEIAIYFTEMHAETRKAIQDYVLSRIEV